MSFKVTCEIVQPPVAEDAPPPPPISLRYDWQGEAVTSSDWTAAGQGGDPGSRATSRPATAEGSRPATAEGEEEEEAPPAVEPARGPLDPPPDQPCFSCEKTHSIATSDDALDALNEDPVVCFILGTEDTPYAQALHVDLSHFFVEDTPLIAVRSTTNSESFEYVDSSDDEDEQAPSSKPAGPATQLLSYVRITVSLENAPFLNDEARKKHNPLSLTVDRALRLPGVRSDAQPLQKYVQPDPHQLLRDECKGAFCVVKPPLPCPPMAGEDLSRSERAIRALGRASASDARGATSSITWNHTCAWLTGQIDRETLEELMASKPLGVEVHDRNLKPSPPDPDDVTEEDQRLALLAAEPDLRLDGWCELVGSSRRSFEVVEKAIRSISWVACKPPVLEKGDGDVTLEEVDRLFRLALTTSWCKCGDDHAHGQADIRVDALLENSAALARAFARNNEKGSKPEALQPLVETSSDVTGRKRRITPKGGVDDWRLNEAQRLCVKTGMYADANSVVGLRIALQRPLRSLQEGCFIDGCFWEGTLGDQPFASTKAGGKIYRGASSEAPFSRLCMMFPYKDGELLGKLLQAMDAINHRTLSATMPGSLVSHQLSEEEIEKACAGELDIVSGFHVIDPDCRTIVLEGLADSIQEICASIPRDAINDDSYRLLADPTVRFTSRVYTAFNVDLKKIRLRDPLPILAESPDIYNPVKVATGAFTALDRLVQLRRSPSLRQLALDPSGGLPEVDQLTQVESKFGEAISLEDMDGIDRRALTADETLSLEEQSHHTQKKVVHERRKAPTDSTTPLHFLESTRNRKETDWLETRKLENEEAAQVYEVQKAARLKRIAEDPIPATYIYSGQKLQYTELAKAAQREELSKIKNCTFVRSTNDNFLSLVVPMVDEGKLERDQKLASKAKWMTKKGFVYPAPREPGTWNRHPKNVSESRAEQLKEEWVEGELFPDPEGREDHPDKWTGGKNFDSIPAFAREFGGYTKPQYEREYNSHELGNWNRLPRGRMVDGHVPPDVSIYRRGTDVPPAYDSRTYYKSVHLEPDKAANDKARKEKLHEEWASRVIVDDPVFKVGGFLQKDRPDACDRTSDILKDPPKKYALKLVRNAKLPSGRRVKMTPAPFSIFATGEFKEEERFDRTLRTYGGPEDFPKDPKTGDPIDFQTRIHRDIMRRASEKILCGKTITPVQAHEVYGDPRWHSGGLDLG